MFRLDYNLMEDIKEIAESIEDTLSRTLRYLLRLGIVVHKNRFLDLIPKKEDVEEA